MTSYYVMRKGEKAGPFEEAEILRRFEEGSLGPNDLCCPNNLSWRESMADWQPIASVLSVPSHKSSPPPIRSRRTPAVQQVTPLFLHISVGRLILMSIVSFGVYEMYWIYRNWRYVKERDNLDIRPFWRGWFGIFYCHSLLRRIHEDSEAGSLEVPSFSPGGLATGWFVLIIFSNMVSRAPGTAASIISAFIPSYLCLVPVQNYVNSVSERRSPGQPYYRWSSGHVVCLVFGIVIWAILLLLPGGE